MKELSLYRNGAKVVVGVDEAGRGPLAGPVVAAAVWFEQEVDAPWWQQIRDSKKLNEARRGELAQIISTHAQVGIGLADVAEIELNNILQASLQAMKRAIENLQVSLQDSHVLVDGKFLIPDLLAHEQRAVVKGDSLIHSIAAASIVAKVTRDNLMKEYSEKFPQYGFAQHKGYGTAAHIQAIKQYGLSPIHRVSFCGNFV
ncbi:MAG TPA: ribonuclease HII [Candidatus Doudnabacteria bacterium]|nr:ribonuclease HII [Candidatus Doudnabacteria bacterium]